MQTQPITSQLNFNGKVVLDKVYTRKELNSPRLAMFNRKLKEIRELVKDKPYDVFIYRNKQNPEFLAVAANETIKKAKSVKEYTVKISPSTIAESIVDAAQDAMNMYEKYISKSIKG